METNTQVSPATLKVNPAIESPDFGSGRYCEVMKAIYTGAQDVFDIDAKIAEKIARQYASDYGQLMKESKINASVGKMNKEGKATLKETATLKGASLSKALKVGRAIQWAGEAVANGVSYGGTRWELHGEAADYVNELAAEIEAASKLNK